MIDYQAIKDSTLPNVPFPETIVSAISVTPELEKILNHNRLDATIPPNTSIKIAEPLQVKSELSAGSVQNPAKPLNPSILPNQNKLSDNLQDFAANVQNAVGPSPDEIFLNPVPDAIAALSLKDQKD